MNIKKVIQYQFVDIGRPILVYYLIIVGIMLLGGSIILITTSGDTAFNGTGFSASFFCFIAGLCLFREYFYLFCQNGVSRKAIFFGTLSSILLSSIFMAITETIFVYVFRMFSNGRIYYMHFMDLYPTFAADASLGVQIILDLILTFLLLLTCFSAGYLIAALFYRSNKIFKIVIAAGLPVSIFVVFPILTYLFPKAAAACGKLFLIIYGFESGNPAYAIVPLVITISFLNIVNYFVIRRAEI